jgi:predicted secreted protein
MTRTSLAPFALSLALVALPLSVTPAAAQERAAGFPPLQDQVVLQLSVEDWVQTQTARVTLEVNAAIQGGDAGKVRDEMVAASKKVAAGDWRIIHFDRSADASGLERWTASLEARLAEKDLGGIADRAKQGSRPGLQVTVGNVDFTPTLAETETARSRLRETLYKRVTEELGRLNAVAGDRKFRIARIDLNAGQPRAYAVTASAAKMERAAPAPMMDGGGDLEVSQKVVLRAAVTLSANAPRE